MNLGLKNVANTNAQVWGGKLLALWEAGMPFEMDRDTLDTTGATSLGGKFQLGPDGRGQPVDTGVLLVNSLLGFGGSAFTAHPHIDPALKHFVG